MSNHSAAPDRTLTTPALAADLAASAANGAAMPGWHIFADFTPPELMVERRVRRVRVAMIAVVVLAAALTFLGYNYAQGQAAQAQSAVEAEEAISASLRSQQQQYAGVTQLEAAVDDARRDLAALLASDVDVNALLGAIWSALPAGITIDQITVTVPDQFSGSSSGTSGSGGAAALDPSDATHVGTVALAGTGTAIDDVPAFIDNLSDIRGVYSPFPTSNQQAEGGTSYSLQFTLTDALLTGRYAVEGDN